MLLGLDIGSSSVKSAILKNGKIVGEVVRAAFKTRYDGPSVDVEAKAIALAVAQAIRKVGSGAKKVDAIALAVMAPSWVAMDKRGHALTAVVTHQDRRSVKEAMELEERVGKERHLKLAGTRPFPGGISSTKWLWFHRHQPGVLKKADLVGHLNTYLHRQMTGARVTDPSNASFMGVYSTVDLSGWSEELCAAARMPMGILPEVKDANVVGGEISVEGARAFGLKLGTPMVGGMVVGRGAGMLAGGEPGKLVNVAGSTDVLALITDDPRPHEHLLTRALGVGKRWMSVGTLAAAGSALNWAKGQFFPDYSVVRFRKLMGKLASKGDTGGVGFEPYLAGDRTSLEQRQGAFTGLTLATTREQMLGAIIESLAGSSATRLKLLQKVNAVRMSHDVMLTGGVGGGLDKVLHRDWPGEWRFEVEEEATLRGLGKLEICI